jgi:hypothetical protein
MNQVCPGLCVANNYYMNHHLLAGHTFCEDAAEAGGFLKRGFPLDELHLPTKNSEK